MAPAPAHPQASERHETAQEPVEVVSVTFTAVLGAESSVCPSGRVGRLLDGSTTQRPSCRWKPKP